MRITSKGQLVDMTEKEMKEWTELTTSLSFQLVPTYRGAQSAVPVRRLVLEGSTFIFFFNSWGFSHVAVAEKDKFGHTYMEWDGVTTYVPSSKSLAILKKWATSLTPHN